ncbi:MAG: ribose-5-phosphate isomerase [Bifidobacteriaceae bacterium]|nr:ribose-5-phosphate isomerase [Bifidobacteriaceae bacterium]
MRIHLATDHAGFELKNKLAGHLTAAGHDVVDHGALAYDDTDDYPAFCFAAAEGVVREPDSFGIVIGGSGNGEQMAANKVAGARAALAWNTEVARLARRHNDANILALGARLVSVDEALAVADAFLAEPFGGEKRHARRISSLRRYEEGHRLAKGAGGPKTTWVD